MLQRPLSKNIDNTKVRAKTQLLMCAFCYLVISPSCLAISGVNPGTVCINIHVYQLSRGRCPHFHGVITDMNILVSSSWSNLVSVCLMRTRYSMTSAVSFDSCVKWMEYSIMQYNSFLLLDSLRGVHQMSCMQCKYDIKHLKFQNTRMFASNKARWRSDASAPLSCEVFQHNAQTSFMCWTHHSICNWQAQYPWLCSINPCAVVCSSNDI